jgi:hypothetical protein
MYDNLVSKIIKGSRVEINNEIYDVLSKAHYTTVGNQEANYSKYKLDKKKVLVIIPSDELVYLGELNNNIQYKRIDKEKIEYNSVIYSKVAEDSQILKNIEFGEDSDVEKECDFIDYQSDDGKKIISFGVLKNGEKADIIANVLFIEDVKVL